MMAVVADLRGKRHLVALGLLLLILALSWFASLEQMASLVWHADAYSHGAWVPIVSLWLIVRSRDRLATESFVFWWPAAIGIAAMSGVWLVGGAAEARIIQHFAFIGAIQFIVVGCLGIYAYRQILFPMLFLFLAIPLGLGLVDPLQNLTAKLVIFALGISGMEFEADGVLIKLSSGYYQIARACAGVKFLNSSLVMGILLCHLTFSSWTRRSLMMVAAILVPILFNAVRVYGTLILGEMTDASFAKGIDHVVYGWGFLSFILILLVAGAYRFGDAKDEEFVGARGVADVKQASSLPGITLIAAGFTPFLVGMWMPGNNQQVDVCPVPVLATPKCAGCGFRQLSPDVATSWIHEAEADFSQSWYFRANADTVMGKTLLYRPDRLGHRLVGTASLVLDEGWQLLGGQKTQATTVKGVAFEESVIWRRGERRLMWRTYAIDGAYYTRNILAKFHLAWMRLVGRPAIAQSLVISTDLTSTIEDARTTLNRFFMSYPPEVFFWPSGDESWGKALCAE